MLGLETLQMKAKEMDVSFLELGEGMIVLSDIMTAGGVCLMKAPAALTPTSINVLKQWNAKDQVLGPVRVRIQPVK